MRGSSQEFGAANGRLRVADSRGSVTGERKAAFHARTALLPAPTLSQLVSFAIRSAGIYKSQLKKTRLDEGKQWVRITGGGCRHEQQSAGETDE